MKKLLVIIVIILLLIIICTCLPWIILFVGYWISEPPNKPEITYGEFSLELVYEINGEERIINDTLVCTYEGIGISEASGKIRKWKSILKSGNEKLVLIAYNNVEIYYDIDPARYYMGDYNNSTYSPKVMCETKYENGTTSNSLIFNEELSEKYGIVIKSWISTPPIENHFN